MENDFLLNASKSQVMDIGSVVQLRHTQPELSYSISNAAINTSDSVKIIGVTLDNISQIDYVMNDEIVSRANVLASRTRAAGGADGEKASLGAARATSELIWCDGASGGAPLRVSTATNAVQGILTSIRRVKVLHQGEQRECLPCSVMHHVIGSRGIATTVKSSAPSSIYAIWKICEFFRLRQVRLRSATRAGELGDGMDSRVLGASDGVLLVKGWGRGLAAYMSRVA